MIDIYENILIGLTVILSFIGVFILFILPYVLITGVVYYTLKFLGAL